MFKITRQSLSKSSRHCLTISLLVGIVVLLGGYAPTAKALTLADIASSIEQANSTVQPRILGTTMLPRGDAKQLRHWPQAFGTWDAEQQQLQKCLDDQRRCPLQLVAWRTMMHRAEQQPFMGKLNTVQAFFNNWQYVKDQREHWASPMASLLRQRGDCEDIVFAKYMSLQLLGIEEDRLRLVAARDAVTGKMHGLLAVDAHLLDNDRAVDEGMRRYTPRYSFNRVGKWLHVESQQVAMVE